jgi:integrase
MERPLASIGQRDIKALIGAIAGRGHETSAHAIFAMIRAVFNWIVDSGDYGIETSPCAKIKPAILIGARNVGSRVLRDHELAAYWRAAGAMGYPFGAFFKLLSLAALRRGEASDAQWSEIDMDARLWVIPAERMKGGAAHAVPLTPDVAALLEALPRFQGGDFVFSTTGGRRPVSGFSKAKARLDAIMKADLERQGKKFEGFKIHDIRRTCRTRFSALPVEDMVRELLLAHARPGLHRVYDLHAYQEEKAHALTLWAAKLRSIVEPKPDNVIPLPLAAVR